MSDDLHQPSDERLVVGLVRGVHGLRGAVRVEVLTDNEERFMPGSVLYREGSDDAADRRQRPSRRPGPARPLRARSATAHGAEELRDGVSRGAAGELPGETLLLARDRGLRGERQ